MLLYDRMAVNDDIRAVERQLTELFNQMLEGIDTELASLTNTIQSSDRINGLNELRRAIIDLREVDQEMNDDFLISLRTELAPLENGRNRGITASMEGMRHDLMYLQLNVIRQKMDTVSNDKIKELEKKLKDCEQEKLGLRQEIETLKRSLETATNFTAELIQQIENKDNKIAELQREIGILKRLLNKPTPCELEPNIIKFIETMRQKIGALKRFSDQNSEIPPPKKSRQQPPSQHDGQLEQKGGDTDVNDAGTVESMDNSANLVGNTRKRESSNDNQAVDEESKDDDAFEQEEKDGNNPKRQTSENKTMDATVTFGTCDYTKVNVTSSNITRLYEYCASVYNSESFLKMNTILIFRENLEGYEQFQDYEQFVHFCNIDENFIPGDIQNELKNTKSTHAFDLMSAIWEKHTDLKINHNQIKKEYEVDLLIRLEKLLGQILVKTNDLRQYLSIEKTRKRIDEFYPEALRLLNPIHVFLKERCDSTVKNPRFKIHIEPAFKMLKCKVEYYDIPFRVGYYGSNGIGETNRNATDINYNSTYARYDLGIDIGDEQIPSQPNKYENTEYKKFVRKQIINCGLIEGYETDSLKTGKNMLQEIKMLIDSGETCMLIGYGQSGSGKTTTMLNNNTDKGLPEGMVTQLMKEKTPTKLEVKEIETSWDELFRYGNELPVGYYKTNNVNCDPGNLMEYVNGQGNFPKPRSVARTKNNPVSSRSHVIITITFDTGKLIVCDLAGVEDVFNYEDDTIIPILSSMETSVPTFTHVNNKDIEKHLQNRLKACSDMTEKIIGQKSQSLEQFIHHIMTNHALDKNFIRIYCDPYNDEEGYKKHDKAFIQTNNFVREFQEFYYSEPRKNKEDLKKKDTSAITSQLCEHYVTEITNAFRSKIKQIGLYKPFYQNRLPYLLLIADIERLFLEEKKLTNAQDTYDLSVNYKDTDLNNVYFLTKIFKAFPHEKTKGEGLNKTDMLQFVDTCLNEMFNDCSWYAKKSNINFGLDNLDVLKVAIDKCLETTEPTGSVLQRVSAIEKVPSFQKFIKKYEHTVNIYLECLLGDYNTTRESIKIRSHSQFQELQQRYMTSQVVGTEEILANIYESILADYYWYQVLIYNCMLRSQEGQFINGSLYYFKKSIISRTLGNIKRRLADQNEMIYYGPTVPGCHNANIQFTPFHLMNPTDTFDHKLDAICKELGTEVDAVKHFFILTVINVSEQENSSNNQNPINNPPLPPYINMNKLKIANNLLEIIAARNSSGDWKLKRRINDIITEYKTEFKERLNLYEYLKKQASFQTIFTDENWSQKHLFLRRDIEKFDKSNELTLIGTMDFMSFTRTMDPGNLYYVCEERIDGLGGIIKNQSVNTDPLWLQKMLGIKYNPEEAGEHDGMENEPDGQTGEEDYEMVTGVQTGEDDGTVNESESENGEEDDEILSEDDDL